MKLPNMNNDRVKYQVEKASSALREALKYGAEDLSAYQLGNIVDALKELDNAGFYLTTQSMLSKVSKEEDSAWKEMKDRVIGVPGYTFHADVEFVSAVSE